MSKHKYHGSIKHWYKQYSSWLGWFGLFLMATTFLCKEVLPKVFESKATEIENGLKAMDEDNSEEESWLCQEYTE